MSREIFFIKSEGERTKEEGTGEHSETSKLSLHTHHTLEIFTKRRLNDLPSK